MVKIVVIEDNPDIIDVVDFILTGDGHEMISCKDGSIANKLDTKPRFDFYRRVFTGAPRQRYLQAHQSKRIAASFTGCSYFHCTQS